MTLDEDIRKLKERFDSAAKRIPRGQKELSEEALNEFKGDVLGATHL